MASTTFVDQITTVNTEWLNDVNALVWTVFNGKATAGTSGTLLRSNGTNIVNTTATYPTTAGNTGTILRSDGTNLVNSTATYPNTTTANQLLYSGTTNTVGGLTSANSSLLVTDGSGVPSLGTAIPNGVTATTQTAGDNSTKVATTAYVSTQIQAAPLRGYIDGFIMSTPGASTGMTVGAGVCSNSTNAIYMTLAAGIQKTTAGWAVGPATGGLDTGAIANSTWYHFYVIRRPDTGAVDVTFSLNATTPTLPANYTQFQRVGSGRTNGSAQWLQFIQLGDYFYWNASVLDINVNNPGTAAVTRTLTVPTGVKVAALVTVKVDDATTAQAVYLSSLDVSDEVPAIATALSNASGDTTNSGTVGNIVVFTNTSAQIRSRVVSSSANTDLAIRTFGWIDPRGKNA